MTGMKRNLRPAPFNAFTNKYNGKIDRITTQVTLFKAFDPSTTPQEQIPPAFETVALWDTGATKSVVTKATANDMGLIPIGLADVNHAGGHDIRNTYLINVFLPNHVGIAGVMASECPDIVGAFGAIVGMDIIASGDFSITNENGQGLVSFRFPSIRGIDYVLEANKIVYADIRMKDPCPCGKKDEHGNHVKFKDCHAKELFPSLIRCRNATEQIYANRNRTNWSGFFAGCRACRLGVRGVPLAA